MFLVIAGIFLAAGQLEGAGLFLIIAGAFDD